jgi:hypothetical protein
MPIFRNKIPAYIEKQYLKKFDLIILEHPNLVKKFTLDYISFEDLLKKYKNYSTIKFYFIQDAANSKMNLGVTFSNNSDYKDISSDEKFVLINNKLEKDENLQEKINFYRSSLATQIGFNGKRATECVIYTISDVDRYFKERESIGGGISRLDLAMIYFYKAKDDDGSDYTEDSINHDRISFAVHSVHNNGFVDEGYDAGDLKP